MEVSAPVQELLNKLLELLPVSDEDLLLRGITAEIMDRVVELKKAIRALTRKYGSLANLEEQIEVQGVSPDDHTLYTDLLEWRAIRHELAQLMAILEAV